MSQSAPVPAICLEIDEVVPSMNRLLRMHWAARHKVLKKWQWLVWLEVYRTGAHKAGFTGRTMVRITRVSRHVLDQDNLTGSAKIVLDALKIAGVIADDSPAHIELHCEQESGAARTIIRLTGMPRTADNELTRTHGLTG